jgi:hypothetical protein
VITVARIIAAGTSLVTLVFMFLHDSWQADNVFLVPDLVLCAVLLAGAVVPAAWAGTTLLAGFALAAGVFITSVSSYAVDGEIGIPSLAGALGSLAMTVLVGRRERSAGRFQQPELGRQDEVHAV